MNRSTRNRNLLSSQRQLSTGLGKASLFIVGLLLVAGCGNQPSTPSSTSATSSAHEIVEPTVTETEKAPTTTEQESSASTTDSSSATSTVTDDDTDISVRPFWKLPTKVHCLIYLKVYHWDQVGQH